MNAKSNPPAEMVHESGRVAQVRTPAEALGVMMAHDGHAYNFRKSDRHWVATRSERRTDAPNGCGEHQQFAHGTLDQCKTAVVRHVSKGWTISAWQREFAAQQQMMTVRDRQARLWDQAMGQTKGIKR